MLNVLREIRYRVINRFLLTIANLVTISYPLPFCGLKKSVLKLMGIQINGKCFVDSGFDCLFPKNIEIGRDCSFGHYNRLWAFNKIKIGPNVQTAIGLTIVSGSHRTDNFEPLLDQQEVVLEGENWIGANVTIVGGVTVGRGSIVGAGSVVTRSIPPYSIAVGVPAKVVKERTRSEKVLSPFGYYKPKTE